MARIYQSGGAYQPAGNYDRTGATDLGGTYDSPTLTNPVTNNALIDTTATTLTLAAKTHDGRVVSLDHAAGITVTLPAATGSGAFFRLLVAATASGGNYVVQVANASDYMRGFAWTVTDTAGTGDAFATANSGTVATESDTITLNGTTQGGRIGDWIECVDVATNIWAVKVFSVGSGTEATPFSAAV